ncbi:phenylalanine--tRNA ligase subunit beta [Vallicoccus soli]|uniref:Phenylalanine--tRNA ligase beta subunit n=1 Tax=Vallicoccus soli TaxID=2339232 RepID=A0A3A3YY35_9ACTN|nr:phenylalanine--tRNA ligase subunit beta [Vallicoccus soli]RJK96701.1 phenylalanine--tRNA ligase subunit beta [Vallicoccus soli]
MRLPMSWLREHVELPEGVGAPEVADALVRAGLEVEGVDDLAASVTGPLVTGVVLSAEPEPQKNGKTITWCQVDVGEAEPRGIVCGAHNFGAGDAVVVALPGSVLPGGFAIARRKTYGHHSDGMICSAAELRVSEESDGIIVLPAGTAPGQDARPLLGLDDAVVDVQPTPDRGYALSVRGLAREVAAAYDLPFRDPVDHAAAGELVAAGPPGSHPVRVEDPGGCDAFVALRITGLDPARPSPEWLARRVTLAGMRSVSLAVDVTNYVMLELGQPLHAYDAARLQGPIVVRRARPGERLTTLDGTARALEPHDLLITDDSGPIGIAGVMGGADTEISATTTEVVLEAAHFDAASVSRSSRRHHVPSEASRRYERGVDPLLPLAAGLRAARLLAELGGGTLAPELTRVDTVADPAPVALPVRHPGDVAGREVPAEAVRRRLEQVGCAVSGDEVLRVVPPSWRPDLVDPADLVEEVLRLEGYDTLPSRLPAAPAGRGLTEDQRLRRRVGRLLATAGLVEAPSYPFVAESAADRLGLPADDARRHALRLANPLSDEAPLLRTTLLPGLLDALRRNSGRGAHDVALFEVGTVFRPRPGQAASAPALGALRRPTAQELAEQQAALPDQPTRLAAVLSGERWRSGWWGPGRPVAWADAVQLAREVGAAAGVVVEVVADEHAPWHPGRCAALRVEGRLVGHTGELHPGVARAWGVPERTAALELDLALLGRGGLVQGPHVSTYPVATQDVALVVPEGVPAAEVEAALREGAGALLESLRLFDVYTGAPVPEGSRSLAYGLRFRAPDRTLTSEEVGAARDAAVEEAARRTGAVLRGA